MFDPVLKDQIRKAAMDARKAYVRDLSDADRAMLEERLAQHLTGVCAGARAVGGYAPFGTEISPARATEEARAVGAIVAYPAFDDPARPFIFRAGDPFEPGPFGMMQPRRGAPPVEPDVILVPVVAVDRRGTRLGRGKGLYDMALARLRKGGARLLGVGWAIQMIESLIPADDWDIPLDAFASPDGLTWFGPGRP